MFKTPNNTTRKMIETTQYKNSHFVSIVSYFLFKLLVSAVDIGVFETNAFRGGSKIAH